MSQQNVEIVRAMVAAFDRGDFDASLQFLDDDVEWHDPPHVPASVFDVRGLKKVGRRAAAFTRRDRG